jgi:hypothetical protein
VLISLLLTAAVRGEANVVWAYTEEEDDDEGESKKGKDEASAKKQRGGLFSPSRSASGPVSEDDEAAEKEQSIGGSTRRDIVFFSVGKAGPWATCVAPKDAPRGPKWIVRPNGREEPTDVAGHAGKRLRTA